MARYCRAALNGIAQTAHRRSSFARQWTACETAATIEPAQGRGLYAHGRLCASYLARRELPFNSRFALYSVVTRPTNDNPIWFPDVQAFVILRVSYDTLPAFCHRSIRATANRAIVTLEGFSESFYRAIVVLAKIAWCIPNAMSAMRFPRFF